MKKSSTSLSSVFSSLYPQIEFSSRSSDSFPQQHVKIEVEVDNVRSSNWNAGGKHEAGYDAFMTGCIYAIIWGSNLNSIRNQITLRRTRNLTSTSTVFISAGQEVISSTLEQAIVMQITGESQSLNTRTLSSYGTSHENSRLERSKNASAKPLARLLSLLSAVFVMFKNSELVWDFLTLKQQLESSDGPVSVLHPLSKILEGGNTGAADYEAYKEICSSHISKILFSGQAETVGVKSITRPDPQGETERREENTVTVTPTASDLIDAFLANRVEAKAGKD